VPICDPDVGKGARGVVGAVAGVPDY